MSNRQFLVTSGLPYSNNRLHVGHIAGAYLPADIYVRYLRARGDNVRFICGSDDNGVAALKSAREEGISVEELTAKYNASQQESFKGLGIEFDIYGGTHQPEFVKTHERLSQAFFQTIHDKGYFTKRATDQLYDTEAHQFLPDRFVKGTCPSCKSDKANGDQCENCGRELDQVNLIDPISTLTGTTPILRETTHWFFRLDQLQEQIANWLRGKKEDKDGVKWRNVVINQSLGRIEAEGLKERAMTRDMGWGVPVPLKDPDAAGKVLYVWFDAPIGYISFTAELCQRLGEGENGYKHWWCNPDCKIVNFIGEDNIVFHAITFPAMMLASRDSANVQGESGEFQLPHNVVANAYVNFKMPGKEEEKMSKSRGTAVWIEDYLKDYDPDPLRYYLTAIAPEQQRSAFEFDDFITRNNGELLAALGNFVNRTMTFAHKYFDGKVPPVGNREQIDLDQIQACKDIAKRTANALEDYRFKSAQEEMMSLARAGNVYFDITKPFQTRKTDMEACGRAVNVCLQTVRTLTTIMAPFLPHIASKCRDMLSLDESSKAWDTACNALPVEHDLGEAEYLVRKIDVLETDAK